MHHDGFDGAVVWPLLPDVGAERMGTAFACTACRYF
jgi:hypothetical protein